MYKQGSLKKEKSKALLIPRGDPKRMSLSKILKLERINGEKIYWQEVGQLKETVTEAPGGHMGGKGKEKKKPK